MPPLTGADKVVARGWMVRTSADLSELAQKKTENYQHTGGIQPPAGEAHVDLNTATAQRMAEFTYKKHFPDGPGFKRFLITSYWRTFSPPPQDVPLALCDGRTSFAGEEKSNTLFIVDEFPEGEALTAPVEGEESDDRGLDLQPLAGDALVVLLEHAGATTCCCSSSTTATIRAPGAARTPRSTTRALPTPTCARASRCARWRSGNRPAPRGKEIWRRAHRT